MADNDMDVIIYKILQYMYECMKVGVSPRLEDINYDSPMLRIPRQYWIQILQEMQASGFVNGFIFIEHKQNILMHMNDTARITLIGQQYLRDNSHMKKARDFLGESFQSVLSATVQAIMASTF